MVDPSPTPDAEQERQRLFQAVWGDASGPRPIQRPRRTPGVDELPPAAAPASDIIATLERQVSELRQSLEDLHQMTEQGFSEMRQTMLRLAEAVQAATKKPAARKT
jgi:hypothetical protein